MLIYTVLVVCEVVTPIGQRRFIAPLFTIYVSLQATVAVIVLFVYISYITVGKYTVDYKYIT